MKTQKQNKIMRQGSYSGITQSNVGEKYILEHKNIIR